jgi:hypothetical protein
MVARTHGPSSNRPHQGQVHKQGRLCSGIEFVRPPNLMGASTDCPPLKDQHHERLFVPYSLASRPSLKVIVIPVILRVSSHKSNEK